LADGQPLDTLNRPRQQALLAYLLLHRHAPQPRQQIAFSFWPDSTERQAYTNLRKLCFDLRQALPHADNFLIADSQRLGWCSDAPFTLDVVDVEDALQRLEQTNIADVAAVARVVAGYRGELFPTCYDEWLLPLRRTLHERVVNTLTHSLTSLITQHEYQAGLRTAEHLLRLDPLHEATYRHLMHLRGLSGDRAGALRVYHQCVTVLEQELSVSPATETQTLYRQLLKAEPQASPVPAPTATPRHEHIPLVGRSQEWQMLLQAWQRMSHGPQFVSIWGEAGIGKTRLVEELLHWARLRHGSVAYARTYAAEGTLAYVPLTEWLRSETVRQGVSLLSEVWQVELARLLPELLAENPALPPPAPMHEGWQRQRFHEALARAMLAAPAPRLLVLDDLQWCDRETLAWLRYLLRFDPQESLLVVGTVRSEATDQQHPLHELRHELQRAQQWSELTLSPLSAVETAELAGYLSKPDVTPWTAQLYAETEGNPLFVVEMVRAGYLERQEEMGHSGALPPTVQAAITTRLDQLSHPARRLAQMAAAIGRIFAVDVLAAASELDDDLFVQGLDELWQRRIVREQSAGYDFSHDKIREVAYAEVSPIRRRQLHGRIAQALERLHGQHLPAVAAELAVQFDRAGLADQARHYYEQAALHQIARFANELAIGYLSRALALTPTAETTVCYRLLQARRALYHQLGRVDAEAGDLAILQQLVDAMEDDGVKQRRRAEVASAVAGYKIRRGDYAGVIAAAQQATALAESGGAREVAAEAYKHWGSACWARADYVEARRHYGRALDLARGAGLAALQAECMGDISSSGFFASVDCYMDSTGYLTEALVLFQEAGDLAGEGVTRSRLGFLIVAQGEGEYAAAQTYLDQSLQIGRMIGHRHLEALSLANAGILHNHCGNYARALTVLHQALAITEHTQDRRLHGAAQAYLGAVYVNMGDFAAAQTTLESARQILHAGGIRVWEVMALGDLGLLHYLLGDYAQAQEILEEALSMVQAYGDRRELARLFTLRGHIHRAAGRIAAATTDYETALAYRRQMDQFNRSLEPLAGLAAVAWRMKRVEQAQVHVGSILDHLTTHALDRTEEALMVYTISYEILQALQDARANDVLALAHERLQARSSMIESRAMRQRFWSTPAHQVVLTSVKEHERARATP
jgi:DNA-binding SARP family transcriptional activator/tetratricopeptide (TPR) repeat protein